MARRSSGSGWAVVLFIVFAVIASIPKEMWVAIGVVATIALVLYVIIKNQSSQASSVQSVPTLREPTRTTLHREAVEIDQSTTSQECWVPAGKSVTIANAVVPGGLVYVGKGLPSVANHGLEPALIDPILPVRFPSEPVARMDYWPSYSRIEPGARGEYLRWLVGGRQDPGVQIGFVFLFFYGIERRVLFDAKQDEEAQKELPLILAEVRRLLSIYSSNNSFFGYANRFVDLIVAVGAKEPLYKLLPPQEGRHKALTVRHKIALAQVAAHDVALPAAWAFTWYVNDDRTYLRAAARRSPSEFKELFLSLYSDKYGDGMKLPTNRTKLRALYKPASASFGHGHIEFAAPDLSDITVLDGPYSRLRALAESTTELLEPYSRFVDKAPEKAGTMDALLLLPPSQWPESNLNNARHYLASLALSEEPKVVEYGSLIAHFSAWDADKKDRVATLAAALGELGVGIEPDVRWGAPIPKAGSSVVLFSLAADEKSAKPSALYGLAALTLHLAASITAADGVVSAEEELQLEEQLETWLHLSSTEKRRLRAHLKWLLANPPSSATLKKRASTLGEPQKRAISDFLVDLAQSDNSVSPAEMKALGKVYKLFGFDEKELFSHVHAAATEPIAVRPATEMPGGFAVPAKAIPPRRKAGFELDSTRIEALKRDSERVSNILQSIFAEAEMAASAAPPEPEPEPVEDQIAGLDQMHSELVKVLASRDSWTRAELEDLAADRNIMLDGALERINEAFLDAHNEPLLEGEDPVEVNRNIAKDLEVA